MNPEDRLDARINSSALEQELKDEIISRLNLYRKALYDARTESRNINKQLSDERWKTAVCNGHH